MLLFKEESIMTDKEFEEYFKKEFGDKLIDTNEEIKEIENILGTEEEVNKKTENLINKIFGRS